MARYSTKNKPKAKSKTNWLPLWLVLIGLGLILGAGWAISNSKAQSKAPIAVKGAPSLKVEKETVDHGDIKLGKVIQDDIRVTNAGDQPLSFSEAPYIEVKEGC